MNGDGKMDTNNRMGAERAGLVVLLTTVASMFAGCGDDNSCVVDSECFAGEACIEQRCAPRPSADVQGQDTNADSNGGDTVEGSAMDAPGDPMGDSTKSDNNASTNGAVDNNTSSNTNNETVAQVPDDPDGACRASALESCPQDDNDDVAQNLIGGFGNGCVRVDNNFAGGTINVDAAAICPTEEVDRYSTTVNPCQSTTFLIDVDVVPTAICASADWELDVSLRGNNCADSGGTVECQDLPGGGKRATLLAEPGSSSSVLYVDVMPLLDGVRFDYDMVITYYQ